MHFRPVRFSCHQIALSVRVLQPNPIHSWVHLTRAEATLAETKHLSTYLNAFWVQIEMMAAEREVNELSEAVRGLFAIVRREMDEIKEELAREREERRREVQELNWPRVMKELAACKEWQNVQDMKLNIELEMRESEGDRKKALKAIKAASQATQLTLSRLAGSDGGVGGEVRGDVAVFW
ncbi:unnamed protein product [Closterium sp. NIES-65]|nr:unnamed protein product [Closterium sp. NIES-65]